MRLMWRMHGLGAVIIVLCPMRCLRLGVSVVAVNLVAGSIINRFKILKQFRHFLPRTFGNRIISLTIALRSLPPRHWSETYEYYSDIGRICQPKITKGYKVADNTATSM